MKELKRAYAACRKIARRKAKNFYYAFRVLPAHKRDAICAVYAFMRRADDIADDDALPLEQRRQVMTAWVAAWRVSRFQSTTDPVFLAIADTQRRFHIPDELLEDLVRGTSMDLQPSDDQSGHAVDLGDGLQGYRTFNDLYRYCYLVASVVGLVCIRIFGYSDPAAALLAEKTGVAFQLTNILRDIKEDAERGRIYLPQDLFAEFNVSTAELLATTNGAPLPPRARAMVHALAVQASEYYGSGWQLIPLIDRDSRAALWVLVKIYSELLLKIERNEARVFTRRVRLSTPAKLAILAQGTFRAIFRR